mmetsp:Transcript_3718/g.6877  ORF Transcript_3718/g.6877 Transcript_3718/m.6877 type:complete len:217 (+) Transcript_3718:251-901(+)
MVGQKRHRGRHHVREDARALAAAKDQKAHRPVAGRRVGGAGTLGNRGAHGVAGMHVLGAKRHLGRPGAAGDMGDMLGKEPVDPAEDAVLLVQHSRPPGEPRGGHGGNGGVAAEAHDDVRLLAHHLRGGREDTAKNSERHGKFRQNAAPIEGGRRDLADFHRMAEAAHVARAARVGRERHPPAATQHRLGQRLRREHVPAGAACRDDEMGLRHGCYR